jgi:hypothetical protein
MSLDDLVLFSVPSALERTFISSTVPLDFAWSYGAEKRGELFVAIRNFTTRFFLVFFGHFIIRMPPTRNKAQPVSFAWISWALGMGPRRR